MTPQLKTIQHTPTQHTSTHLPSQAMPSYTPSHFNAIVHLPYNAVVLIHFINTCACVTPSQVTPFDTPSDTPFHPSHTPFTVLGYKDEVRRFRAGLDYTVAHYGAMTKVPRLDATLCFVDESIGDEEGEAGKVKKACLEGEEEEEVDTPWHDGESGASTIYLLLTNRYLRCYFTLTQKKLPPRFIFLILDLPYPLVYPFYLYYQVDLSVI